MDGIAALVHNAHLVVEKCEKYVRRDYQGLCLVRERGRNAPNWTKRDRQRLAFFSGSLSAIGRGILPPFLQGRQPLTFANDYIDGFPPPGRMAKYHDWLYPRIGEPKIEEWGTVALATAVLSNQIALLEPKIYAVKECVKRLIDEAYEASCDGRNWDSSESDLHEQFHEEIFRLERARQAVAIASQQLSAPKTKQAHQEPPQIRPFAGGELVFFADRVELCGADICSGPRCDTRRQLLELLSQQIDGRYVGCSGEEIALSLKLAGGAVAVAGLVRDLRDEIVASLRDQAGIACDRQDVVLSRGAGYRLSPSISVSREIPSVQGTAPGPSVRDGPNRGDPDRDDPDDPDRDDPDVPDDSSGASAARQAWILEQLADNRELRAPDVARQFRCSLTTAKRALQALKRAGRIVFVGEARTGSYRLNRPQGSSE
jgi:hypothetical protein